MSKEYGNVVTHDLHVCPEVWVIFTLEIQLDPGEICRVMMGAGEEMQQANLETLFSSWTAERCMLG